MINRTNWKLVNKYLEYRREVDQVSESTLRLEETWLRHLLEWADDVLFREAPKIRPTFPEYVLAARIDGGGSQLSKIYMRKVVGAAKRFLRWLTVHRAGYKTITPAWLDTLKPVKMAEQPREHKAVTFEEVLRIARAPVQTSRDRRIRAAAVLWFLSGIRISAFVTLPLSAVELGELRIKQWPKMGVHTKFGKHATTYLLDIPELLEVVSSWDREVRRILPEDGLWFAPFSSDTGEINPTIVEVGRHRHQRARKDLMSWCQRVGIPYYSPHKFRHGHAVYALKRAKDIQALKAVSQNLMHSNISITDGVYGVLSDGDVREQIVTLGQRVNAGEVGNLEEIIPILEVLLANLKEKKRY